jgi:hypothetical protein
MVTFMTCKGCVMDEMADALLLVPQQDLTHCSNKEIAHYTSKLKTVLTVSDGLFPMARIPSGKYDESNHLQLQKFVMDAMVLWRNIELSIAPKPHCIEDHMCDQVLLFNGNGDLTEDFIEQAHQYGIQDNLRSRHSKLNETCATLYVNWE